jgi:predicted nucleotidyltransferase
MEPEGLLRQKRSDILRIAAAQNARDVRIFGSWARDEVRPGSDVDLLVRLDAGRSLLDIIAIRQDLEDLLGLPVDVVTEAGISPYLRDQILGEAVAL